MYCKKPYQMDNFAANLGQLMRTTKIVFQIVTKAGSIVLIFIAKNPRRHEEAMKKTQVRRSDRIWDSDPRGGVSIIATGSTLIFSLCSNLQKFNFQSYVVVQMFL